MGIDITLGLVLVYGVSNYGVYRFYRERRTGNSGSESTLSVLLYPRRRGFGWGWSRSYLYPQGHCVTPRWPSRVGWRQAMA